MKLNPPAIEQYILKKGKFSRGELASVTGMSLSSISNYVGKLKREGVLMERKYGGRSAQCSGPGRNTGFLSVNPDLAFALGCEVRHDMIQAQVVDLAGRKRKLSEFRREITGEGDFLEHLKESVAAAVRDAPAPGRVACMGVCLSGSVNFSEGTVVHSPAVCNLENLALGEILEEEFSMPAVIENDSRSMGVAERQFSPAAEYEDMIFIHVNEGIGAAIFIGGALFRGGGGMGGEVGHISVCREDSAPLCVCGSRGCLQVVASCSAMVRRAGELAARGVKTAVPAGGEDFDFKALAEAAESGDRAALIVFEEAAGWLARGIGDIVNVLNPRLVVLGGEITAAEKFLKQKTEDLLQIRAIEEAARGLRLEFSRFGKGEASYGAALLALGRVSVLPGRDRTPAKLLRSM